MGNNANAARNGDRRTEEEVDVDPDGVGPMIMRGKDGEPRIHIKLQEKMPKRPITCVVFELNFLKESGVAKNVSWLLRSDGVTPIVYSRDTVDEVEIELVARDVIGMKTVRIGDCGRVATLDLAREKRKAINVFNGVRKNTVDLVLGLKARGERVLYVGGETKTDARTISAAHIGVATTSAREKCKKAADWILLVDDPRKGPRVVVNALRVMQPVGASVAVEKKKPIPLSPAVRGAVKRSRGRRGKRRKGRRRVTIEDALRVSP